MYDEPTILVKREELLEAMRANRAKHRKVFEDALEGYRRAAIELLDSYLKQLHDGKRPALAIALPQPEDHTEDYDRVIRMYEMHQEDKVTIDEDHFARYVMDQWNWKRQFLTTNSRYAAGTVQEVYGS